jgi:ArsR family transcriptional regulator, arsenate/arsenite/antimonite-responsive transcriptional repressor
MKKLASLFKALSDETRLMILGLLLQEGELCVCVFVAALGISQSKASRHLRHLVNAGLLQDRREAVWVYYRIVSSPKSLQKSVLDNLRQILPATISAKCKKSLDAWRKSRICTSEACEKP